MGTESKTSEGIEKTIEIYKARGKVELKYYQVFRSNKFCADEKCCTITYEGLPENTYKILLTREEERLRPLCDAYGSLMLRLKQEWRKGDIKESNETLAAEAEAEKLYDMINRLKRELIKITLYGRRKGYYPGDDDFFVQEEEIENAVSENTLCEFLKELSSGRKEF